MHGSTIDSALLGAILGGGGTGDALGGAAAGGASQFLGNAMLGDESADETLPYGKRGALGGAALGGASGAVGGALQGPALFRYLAKVAPEALQGAMSKMGDKGALAHLLGALTGGVGGAGLGGLFGGLTGAGADATGALRE